MLAGVSKLEDSSGPEARVVLKKFAGREKDQHFLGPHLLTVDLQLSPLAHGGPLWANELLTVWNKDKINCPTGMPVET